MSNDHHDVIVVGGGNAALCAALSAQDAGASVLVLERAPVADRGGNSSFAGGLFRAPYEGLDDLRRVMPDLSDSEVEGVDFGTYPAQQMFDDLAKVSDYRADPDLVKLVVDDALNTLAWMRGKGVRFLPPFGRRSYHDGEVTRFKSGSVIESSGGGPGLIEMLYRSAKEHGVEVRYDSRVRGLLIDDHGVCGVRVGAPGGAVHEELRADAVVLASGGFSSNPAWRSAHLGRGWDLARVRGTRFNTGDGIEMARDAGADLAGNWSGCHATPWELYAPEFGDQKAQRSFFRAHYNFGVMVNRDGRRFVDEGADHKNFTYARYGGEILRQPGHFAWQVFDGQVADLLGREEYRSGNSTRVTADTIEELGEKMEGVDATRFVRTMQAYNSAVDHDTPFNPSVLDGKAATLDLPKSNWATPLDTPPFEAFAVTCGITFTFGGVRIDPATAAVVDAAAAPIPGLYAAGELVGGLFYSNYAAGTGLTTGAVIGRQAGTQAAKRAS